MVVGLAEKDNWATGVAVGAGTGVGVEAGGATGGGTTGGASGWITGTFTAPVTATNSWETQPMPPGGDGKDAYLRMKGAKALKGRPLAVLRELYRWRERTARRIRPERVRPRNHETAKVIATEK